MSRAAEVIEFLDRHSPSSSALLDVLWWCRTKDEDTTDPGERTKVMKLPLARPRHPWRLATYRAACIQQVMKLRSALFCACMCCTIAADKHKFGLRSWCYAL